MISYNLKINFLSVRQAPLILICLISLFGAIVYRVYALNNIGAAISVILAIVAFIILFLKKTNKTTDNRKFTQPLASGVAWIADNRRQTSYFLSKADQPWAGLLLTSYFLLLTSCLYILFTHQTAAAIASPWQAVPKYFFLIYGVATAVLTTIIIKQSSRLNLFLIILHYFLSFSAAVIIYKLGYGFDPFIHNAAVNLINKTGAIEPKPFYYLGQYALLVITHKITTVPLFWLDKLLVPLLAAIYIPITLQEVVAKLFSNKKNSMLTVLMLLALPFTIFIATTPQSFAYLLLVLVILLGLVCNSVHKLIIIYILSLAALAVHPIAGIPALMFALFLTVYHSDKQKLKKYFYVLIFIISSIALPTAFAALSAVKAPGAMSAAKASDAILGVGRIFAPGQENFILNFIYLYGFNFKIVIAFLVIAGLAIVVRYRNDSLPAGKAKKIFSLYFLMSTALYISFLLATNQSFNFLIEYEKNNYTDRVAVMAVLFLIPFIITSVYWFTDKILKQVQCIKIPILLFIIILTATSLYLSYPRKDSYFNSRGVSTSQNDINAVRWIEENAKENYIVLANQQVSAAALREFGFKKYYEPKNQKPNPAQRSWAESKIFYYPIPTGGPLYQYYLDMVYKEPSRETMEKAMELTGVQKSYFVLNKYWWAFPKILEEAKLEADSWKEFGEGEIYVFEYSL